MFIGRNMEYDKQDLAVPAVFRSKHKAPRFRLEKPKEVLIDGQRERQEGTGYDARFVNYRFICHNSKALKLLLDHPYFRHSDGFDIDQEDPSGFWEAMGAIERVPVNAARIMLKPGERPDSKLSVKQINDKLAKANPDDRSELLVLDERTLKTLLDTKPKGGGDEPAGKE